MLIFDAAGRVEQRLMFADGELHGRSEFLDPRGRTVRYRPGGTLEETTVYVDGEPVGDPVPHDEEGRPERSIPKPEEEPAAGGDASRPGGEATGADRPEGDWF